jgi:hypothetical protein
MRIAQELGCPVSEAVSGRGTSCAWAEKDVPVHLRQLALAALGGFVTYFLLGFLLFGLLPQLRRQFSKYPAVYRNQEGIKRVMPFGMAAIFVAMLALAVLYAMLYQGASPLAEGARFGALIGLYSVCSFVVHNYVTLNIGLRLALLQAGAYFVEWTLTGAAIGLPYRPAVLH